MMLTGNWNILKCVLLVLFLCSATTVFAQTPDVIKASGGTNLSIDSVATQGFSSLDGPTIRETASGQLSQGGTIVLTLPSGFVWNDTLSTDDITITIEPTGAANTKLDVNFTSITTSEATFTVASESSTNGKGQGPGRVDIQGLQLRPSTTDVPTTGQISNTGSTGPDKNYGDLSTAVGAISQVWVETAADGTGQVVPSQDILAGNSITVYSIGRDVGDNFVRNVALNSEADWTLVNMTGTIQQTAISASGDLKSATFSSQKTGTAQIQAAYSGATAVPSETITVLPREPESMVINTQPSSSATAGEAFAQQPVIFLHDQFGNKVTTDNSTQVTASINSGNGSLSGTLTQTASSGEIAFTDLYTTVADTITLNFDSAGLSTVTSTQTIVNPALASDLEYVQQPSNTAENNVIDPPVKLQLLDEFGNNVSASDTTVSISNESFIHENSSTLTVNTDADGIATFDNIKLNNQTAPDTVQLTAQFNSISSPVTSTSFFIISSDALAGYDITNTGGTDITAKQAGTSFDITITAKDGSGKDFTFNTDSTLTVTADNQIQSGSFDVVIQSGNSSVTTSLALISTGTTKLYADADEDISGESNSFNVMPSDSIDVTKSTISAYPQEITADGNSTATITVQLKDEFGNNLESGGETVELTTDAGTFDGGVTTITATDEGDGTYTSTLTSSTDDSETATISGTVNTRSISDEATVDFIPGEVSTFTFTLPQDNGSPATQTAGVPFDIDIQAVDANNNIVTSFNGDVTLSSNSTLTSNTAVTFSNGVLQNYSVTLTKADSNATLTATADDLFGVSGTSSSFIVRANTPDAGTSQLTATPDVLQNITTEQSVISVILRDQYNNRVYQQTPVSLSLEQLELNNSASSGSPDASLANGSNIPFDSNNGIYRDTLSATSTIELVKITGFFGSSSTQISQTDTVDIVVPNTWEGDAKGPSTAQTDWTNPDNWSQGSQPTSDDFVIIPDVQNMPELDLNITIGSFEVQSGANVTLFGGNAINISGNTTIDGTMNIEDNTEITIGGNFNGSGSFTAGSSTKINIAGDIILDSFLARTTGSQITLNGTTPQAISTPSFLAQNLNIQNDVNVTTDNDLIDTSVLTINAGRTMELNIGAMDTLDVSQSIQGDGTLLINDNTLVLGGNTDLSNIDASQGTVIFGVRLGVAPSAANLSQQQILNLSEMKNAIINNDHGVKTFEDIIVEGTLTLENGPLIINSGKSLIASNQVYNNGSLQIKRTISGQPGWRMISAPINTTFSDLFDELTVQGITGSEYPGRQPNLLYYNETISGTDNQRWRAPDNISDNVHSSNPDSLGRGYFFYVFGDVEGDSDYNDSIPVTLSIPGEEYQYSNNTFNFSSVTYTAEADTGWNLVGNPWAATLDWDTGGWTKTNMDNVIYVWNPATNSYDTWNGIDGSLGNGLIQPFQAFWVKANGAGSPVLSVDKSAKATGGTFRGKNHKKPESIEFLLEADTLQETTHITLSPNGKNGKDRRDAFRLLPFDTGTYLELFTTLGNGTELSINNIARDFGKEISIPIHVGGYQNYSALNGTYTLSWPEIGDVPKEWTLTLEDRKTEKTIDLRKHQFYSFDLSQSEQTMGKNTIENFKLVNTVSAREKASNSRFVLHILPGDDAEGLPDKYSLGVNYPNPFTEKTTIEYATPLEGSVQILIYDILGRKIKTLVDERQPADFHEVEWNADGLASGVYICVMRAGGKQFTKKLTYIK